MREVREETGLRCELVQTRSGAPPMSTGAGATRSVRPLGDGDLAGRSRPGIEVDRLLWLSIGDAVKRLTYGRDKTLLLQPDQA